MFTITFKGKPNPKDKNLVKIEMVLFRTGYNRTPKIINITGLYTDWDQKTQHFKVQTSDYQTKNKALLELKSQYLKVAEEWEAEGVEWSPIQWSHCFDSEEEIAKKEKIKVQTVSQCIDVIIEKISNQKRLKNGKFISCKANADNYHHLRVTLNKFTTEKYGRKFSTYFFKEINEQFLKDFVLYLQERGVKNGTQACLPERLKKLWGVFCYSREMGQPHTDTKIFNCVESHFKRKENPPQTIPPEWMIKIETMDKSQLKKQEKFHIDLFLFSYYCGGIAPIDACFLTWNSIENHKVVFERTKFPKEAEMPLTEDTKRIIRKYADKCYENYVLPVINHKHVEEKQKLKRIKSLMEDVNATLKKVAKELKLEYEFTWYAARGTFITKMINDGFHPVEVAKMCGNSPQTIYKYYWKQTNPEDLRTRVNNTFAKSKRY